MKKMHIEYELTDQTTGTIRVLAADKIAFESFARAHGQPVEDGPRAIAFMLYTALKRAQTIPTELPFDEFTTGVLIDMAVTADDPAAAENPTK